MRSRPKTGRIRTFAARSDDAQHSSVASKDAPLIGTLPVTDGERANTLKVQL
jgi:hypothetical protein